MGQRLANTLALAVLCAVGGAASRARAYEDQVALGLGVGFAYAIDADREAPGVLVDLSVNWGLDEAWALRGRFGYAEHPGTPALHALLGSAELLYLVDIVEFVPYAGLGLGVIAANWGSDAGAGPAPHVVAGCDYLVTRSFALQLDLRAAWLQELAPAYYGALVSGVLIFDR